MTLNPDSTLKITCSGYTFTLNQTLACTSSTFFKTACQNTSPDPHTHEIHLHLQDQPPLLIYKMLTSFHNNKDDYLVDRNDHPKLRFAWDLDTHARMYVLAETFGAARLKKMAARKFKHALKRFEERGRWDELRRDRYFGELVGVVVYIFSSSTPEDDTALRTLVGRFLDTQIRRTLELRLKKVYRAISTAVQGGSRKECFVAIVRDIEVQHQLWLAELSGGARWTDSDGEVDLSVRMPSWLRGSG